MPTTTDRVASLKDGTGAADLIGVIAETVLTLVAARSRATAAVPARWHAVEVHRAPAEVDGACELTLCGTLARVSPDAPWPADAPDACPSCAALTS